MNESTTRHIGLDVHKGTIAVALADSDHAPVLFGAPSPTIRVQSGNWFGRSGQASG